MKKYLLSISLLLFLVTCYSKSSSSNMDFLIPLVITKTDALSMNSSGGSSGGGKSPHVYDAIDTNKFWVYNAADKVLYQRDVDLVTQSINYKIWIQKGAQSEVYVSMADYVNELEKTIHPILIKNFGTHNDLNKDGKVDILISNTIDDNQTGNGFVAGYVSSGDYTNSRTSNKRDILYMNSRSSLKKTSFYSTTIHELQHLYRLKYQDLSNNIFDSTWINEGTSEYISDEAGYGPQKGRLNCYYSSCSMNGQSIFDKRGTLGLYAFRYMFLSYLYHSASTEKTSRADFVYKVTTGFNKTSTRAKNAKGLFESFNTYARDHIFKRGILGSDYREIFYKLYGSLLFQTNPFSKYGASKTAQKDVSSSLDFSSIISKYPIPAHLTKVHFSNGSSIDGRNYVKFNTSSPTLNPSRSGESYFYKGNPVRQNNYIYFTQYLKNSSGTTLYTLKYNYSMTSFGNIQPSVITSNLDSSSILDTTHLNKSYKEDTPVCIHEQLNKKLHHELNNNPNLQFISE